MLKNTATPERYSFQQRRGAEPSDLSSARSDRGKSKEPTSGLEPLTSSHYERSVRRCRGVAQPCNPRIFRPVSLPWIVLCCTYCVPGGARVGSNTPNTNTGANSSSEYPAYLCGM